MGQTLSGMAAARGPGRVVATPKATRQRGQDRDPGVPGDRAGSRRRSGPRRGPVTQADVVAPKTQVSPSERGQPRTAGFFQRKGSEVVDRQRGQRERHEHLEGPALDPEHLEDRQEQAEVAQDQEEVAERRAGSSRARQGRGAPGGPRRGPTSGRTGDGARAARRSCVACRATWASPSLLATRATRVGRIMATASSGVAFPDDPWRPSTSIRRANSEGDGRRRWIQGGERGTDSSLSRPLPAATTTSLFR